MLFNNIYEELSYKFQYLPDMKPDNVKNRLQLFNNVLNDDFVHSVNPTRYSFYLEFMKALKNPEILKNLIYEYSLIKNDKENESEIISNIISNFSRLYNGNVPKKMMTDENDKEYLQNKTNRIKDEINFISDKMKNIVKSDILSNEQNTKVTNNIETIVENTFQSLNPIANNSSSQPIKGGAEPQKPIYEQYQNLNNTISSNQNEDIKKYVENIQKLQKTQENGFLNKNKENLKTILESDSDNKIKLMKLKDLMENIENNEAMSINNMKLTKEDRLIFIGITFLIRQINLWIIDWALYTNFVTNFTNTFILYIVLYTIFILLILSVVNITYNTSVFKLYTSQNNMFGIIASSLYYFYLIPGYTLQQSLRFVIHLGIIYTAIIIALLIKQKDENNNVQNYNYEIKKNIKRFIGDFTLLIWLFLSFIAMYMF